jgi:hypothetical protein
MNPKQFLQVGGMVLILVGILGFVGLIGPTPQRSFFGSTWWFDNAENWAHTLLGAVALLSAFILKQADYRKWLVAIIGVVGILFALINLFLPTSTPNFFGANLENPMDTILHFFVGLWALWVAFGKKDIPGYGESGEKVS